MTKNGNRGHRIKAGKKVQRRRRARERRLLSTEHAAATESGAASGGGSADGRGIAEASARTRAAGEAAFATSSTAGGALKRAAVVVESAGGAEAQEETVAVPPVGGVAAEGAAVVVLVEDEGAAEGAAADSPAGPLSSRLRRQRARLAAEATRVRRGAATDASVEAALLPYEFAPGPAPSSTGDGCTPREISALRLVSGQVRARPGEGDVCVVCQEGIGGGDTLYELPCLHVLHPGCAHGWLSRQNRCPVCSRPAVMCV